MSAMPIILLLGLGGGALLLAGRSSAKTVTDQAAEKKAAEKKAAEKKAAAKKAAEKSKATKSPGIADLAKKPAEKTVADMSVEMKQMIATVLKNLGVDENGVVSGEPTPDSIAAATNLASVLEQQGYEQAAKQLREYAKAAGKKVKVPDKIVTVPGLSPEMQEAINRAIKMERDPKKLRALAAALRLLPNASDPQVQNSADMLDALAAQVEAGQQQATVLTEIDQTIKQTPSTTLPHPVMQMPADFDLDATQAMQQKAAEEAAKAAAAIQAAATQVTQASSGAVIYIVKQGDNPYALAKKYAPGGGGQYMQLLKANPQYPKNSKGDNFKNFYAGMRLNWPPTWRNPNAGAAPLPVPALPTLPDFSTLPGQPTAPQPKTPVEQAAEAMVSQLNAVLRNSGGDVKVAKGKEDTGLVSAFQTLAGVSADGKPGPGTMALAAEHGQCELPLVFRWPKSATSKNVLAYRQSLLAIASRRDAAGQTACANSLRMAAARERGQAGIVGAMPT